jgi:multimeric flavodoxin WrbA
MKHVVAVNGSSKNANTQKLLTEIADLLEEHQIQVTIINLGDYKIDDCIGCELCIRKTSACFQKDDAQEILAKLINADGIILASPVYMMHLTGKLKSLIDKTASWVHRPPLIGKPVLLAATTAGAGLKEVHKYLEQVAIQWGAQPTEKIGRSVISKQSPSQENVERFVWHLNNPVSSYKPSLNQLMQFQVQKVLALKVSTLDRRYWVEQGWDRQSFYYPCRISFGKRIIAWCFYQVLSYRIRPENSF